MVVPRAGEVRREGLLGGVAGRAVAAVMREGNRLGERDAQVRDPGNPHRDLGDLDGMGEAGPEMVILRGDEDLALAREPTPRA